MDTVLNVFSSSVIFQYFKWAKIRGKELLLFYLSITEWFLFIPIYAAFLFWACNILRINVGKSKIISLALLSFSVFFIVDSFFKNYSLAGFALRLFLNLAVSLSAIALILNLSFKKSLNIFFLWNFLYLVFFYVPVDVFRDMVLDVGVGMSDSMADTITRGDISLNEKYYYGYSFFNHDERLFEFHKPQRGDIIEFISPSNQKHHSGKRCIGIPGDVLVIKNKELYINGQLQKEDYVKHTDSKILSAKESPRDNYGPVTVLENHYFVMGDNRDQSSDSRYWGQLDEKLIIGKVELLMRGDGYSRKIIEDAKAEGY